MQSIVLATGISSNNQLRIETFTCTMHTPALLRYRTCIWFGSGSPKLVCSVRLWYWCYVVWRAVGDNDDDEVNDDDDDED